MIDEASKMRVYVAGPLFSTAEHEFNRKLKKLLEPYFEVYLPQDDGGLMVDMIESGIAPLLAARNVFDLDVRAIQDCDVMLVILDGRSVDEGAAFELGFAYALGKPCYAIKTDPRQLLPHGNNPMVDCALIDVFDRLPAVLAWAREFVQRERSVSQTPAVHYAVYP